MLHTGNKYTVTSVGTLLMFGKVKTTKGSLISLAEQLYHKNGLEISNPKLPRCLKAVSTECPFKCSLPFEVLKAAVFFCFVFLIKNWALRPVAS